MTDFIIGRLELATQTQASGDWNLHEKADFVMHHDVPALAIVPVDGTTAPRLAKALKVAVREWLVISMESEGVRTTEAGLMACESRDYRHGMDAGVMVRHTQLLFHNGLLYGVAGQLDTAGVKAMSADIPKYWRLTLTWGPWAEGRAPLEWLWLFEPGYKLLPK